jgi:hypothetical protein
MRRLQQQSRAAARLLDNNEGDGVDGAMQLVREIHSDVSALKLQLALITTTPRAAIAPNYLLVVLSALATVGFTSALLLLNTETTRIVALIGLAASVVAAGAVLLATGWLRVGGDSDSDGVIVYSKINSSSSS